MQRNKIKYSLIILLLMNGFAYSQTKDYKQLYSDLTKDVSTEKTFYEKTSEFFNSMDDNELPIALADISKGEGINFIAHNLIGPNQSRLKENKFRGNMINELSKKSNSSDFKIVLIDFISDFDQKEDEHIEEFNHVLFQIANNNNVSDNLCFYAAYHLGISKDFETTQKQLNELLKSNNLPAANGASKALRKFLFTNKTNTEPWIGLLIEKVNENYNSLNEVNSIITTLSLTKSSKAKEYLLQLFNDNVSTKPQITRQLTYSLSNIADAEVLNTIFTNYSKHNHYDNFGSELALKQIVSDNIYVVDKLYYDKNEDSKINFLRAVKYMENKQRNEYLEKVKESLTSKSSHERLESVKTLHFMLPYEEQKIIFRKHLNNENDHLVKNEIYYYIGIK